MADSRNRARRRIFTWRNVERSTLFVLWLVLLVASALGYFGREDWRLDLFANFKMQYYLGALGLSAVAAWRRYRILLGLFLIVVGWNGWVIVNFASQSVEPGPRVYRAVSANVLTQNDQIERVEAWIREQKPDFVSLIEITGDWRPALERLSDILPHQRVQMWGDRYGSAVLSRYPPVEDGQRYPFAGVGSVALNVVTPDGRLNILLIHPMSPTNEKAWQWRSNALTAIAEYARDNEGAPMLVMGDMNTTPWSPAYKDFVSQSELSPVVTSFLPRRTWPTQNPLLWIPIDHFFLGGPLGPVSQWTGPDLGSDHYPIVMDFCFAPQSE